MTLDQSTTAALNSLDAEYEKSKASDGSGGMANFPDAGEHDCLVLSVTVSNGTFKYSLPNGGDKMDAPCTQVIFEYELVPDAADPDFDPDKDTTFMGAPFQFVSKDILSALPEGQQIRCRIQMDRWKGHMTQLLGRAPSSSISGDLTEVMTKLSGDSVPSVVLFASHRAVGDRVYKTEFLRESIGA